MGSRSVRFTRTAVADAVARSTSWAGALRALGSADNGGRRRALQRLVAEYGVDTGHFADGRWLKYSDAALAEAVATSTTLRQIADKLGAGPAGGMLSHLRRRIEAAGLDTSGLPGLHRTLTDLRFSREELTAAATRSTSLRGAAEVLGLPDDGRVRAALRRDLHAHGVDISHFGFARTPVPEAPLRAAVQAATCYADVLRALDLPVDRANHRRVHTAAVRLRLDTTHFTRRTRRSVRPVVRAPIADRLLRVLPPDSPRVNRERLHRALEEIGRPYACANCANPGAWQGARLTLQIDHVNGDRLDNRRENLRYLCPNCHAQTTTWCGRNRRARQ